jgi:cold shock CspA family protein
LWAFTYCNIYKGKKLLQNIRRNSEKFPFKFIENHTDGHDYFICGEDYQGQTIIQLDTNERVDYIGEKGQRGLEFCWQKVFVSPDHKKIAVQGFAKNKPKDYVEYRGIRFYEFDEPMNLPLGETGDRIGYPFDEAISWEDSEHFLVAVDEERRQSDDKKISSMTEEERKETLSDSGEGFAIKRVIYSQPVQDGVRKEVYSEWLT